MIGLTSKHHSQYFSAVLHSYFLGSMDVARAVTITFSALLPFAKLSANTDSKCKYARALSKHLN